MPAFSKGESALRILVVNANTSQFVTDRVAEEARRSASSKTDIHAVTGEFGPRIIGTRTERAIATYSMIDLMARHGGDCDAALIAVSFDTALDAAREMLPVPVVGMTEAALLTACMLGGGIGLVCFDRRSLSMYREIVACHGLDARVAGWNVVESKTAYQPGDTSALERHIVDGAEHLVKEDGAETIILLGAVMAGIPRRLQDRLPVPVLDGIGCGIRQAELLVRLGAPKPKAGSYAAPKGREVVNVSDSLRQILEG